MLEINLKNVEAFFFLDLPLLSLKGLSHLCLSNMCMQIEILSALALLRDFLKLNLKYLFHSYEFLKSTLLTPISPNISS